MKTFLVFACLLGVSLAAGDCGCEAGYRSTCVDVDECALKTDNCDCNNGQCTNTAGGFTCSCKEGYKLAEDGKTCRLPETCAEVRQLNSNAKSGVYKLETKSGSKYKTYCHYEAIPGCGAGPWTLVLRGKGDKDTFAYDSDHWRTKEVLNPDNVAGGLTATSETKAASYWLKPVKSICLGLKTDETNWLKIIKESDSLYALMNGSYSATEFGRGKWKKLIKNSSLQRKCNKEGINVPRVRIGIMSNQESNCKTPDSYIGFGLIVKGNSIGNYASGLFRPDNGAANIKAVGYVLVQ